MKMNAFQVWLNFFSTSCLRKVNFDKHLNALLVVLYYKYVCVSVKMSVDDLCLFPIMRTGNNPIYNLLPDILGKLSKQNLIRESFCNVMQFLIGSIKKV